MWFFRRLCTIPSGRGAAVLTSVVGLLLLVAGCASVPSQPPSQTGDKPRSLYSGPEFIFIEAPEGRTVLVDGQAIGQTNHVLTVEQGYHEISLSPEEGPVPATVTLLVRSTSPISPLKIRFNYTAGVR